MLPVLNSLSSIHSKPQLFTNHDITQFLDYVATYSHVTIRYNRNDMVLYMHSDASFLCEPNTKSRIGGFIFMNDQSSDPTKPLTQ